MTLASFLADFLGNLGMSFSDVLLFGLILTTFLFYAHDIRYGLVIQFITFAYFLVWLNGIGGDISKVLILLFVVLVLMTLSSLISFRKTGIYNT